MASEEGPSRSASPTNVDNTFPQYPPRAELTVAGPPSVISSRMTDIGTEDGQGSDTTTRGGVPASANPNRRSGFYSDTQSRPETSGTGLSSRGPWAQSVPLRQHLSGKRGSIAGSIGSAGGRPISAASRSHVPSLTSHAFFRPMSSQKLQAQRGAGRPSTMNRPYVITGEAGARNSVISTGSGRIGAQIAEDAELRMPSRGTEMTEQETMDRMTANTSPTNRFFPTSSLTDSVRPLQPLQRPVDARHINVEMNKDYREGSPTTPPRSPTRTSRSFRSSFLMPRMNESGITGSNREIEGGEKLQSAASSPNIPPQNYERQRTRKRRANRQKDASLGKNYEYFEGNTVFCLGGRFQNTKQRPINIATGSLIVLPCILFFIFSAPWIWHNISPVIPITFAYLAYICVSSFAHASASDPGILPRNLHKFPPPEMDDSPMGPPTTDWVLVHSAEASTAAMEVPIKYCKTCQLWRPPRAHHCRLCDNCVETQDHHCVWLNNCVGRRNYRYFFTFVSSATVLALYLIGASLAQILVYKNRHHTSFGHAVNHFRVPFAMVFYGFLAFLYPAALTGYHVFLMARGETTREYLNSHKFPKSDRYRAFTQANWLKNWFVVLCRPRPPTYYGFKVKYNQGDQRLGSHRRWQQPVISDSKEGMEMQNVSSQLPQTGFMGPTALRNSNNGSAQEVVA
ncbi:DHHC palmitoyltransferase-domain-containing protein [Pseudoneurospora amorphoporcata]|uniref:Palmitoyltransferase n=1 Tax=Pseudoneurospora amorphoporcata TaxID=241081 RepID=A0AAN6SAH1_9PEZI|nr:DHHC palmitoyltransferase-domain-containing protein [Pseudoneurospora amorphoporcata]